MGLNRKRLLTALYFSNRIIQRNFPLRIFINVGNSFMGAHSFSSANALYLHGIRHPSLPTAPLTVAVALLTSRLSSWRQLSSLCSCRLLGWASLAPAWK